MKDPRFIILMVILFLTGILAGGLLAVNYLPPKEPAEEPPTNGGPPAPGGPDGDNGPPPQAVVKIYFCKRPESLERFDYVVAVQRRTARRDVAGFAMEQLIAGPTAAEQNRGLFTALKFRDGASNCSGRDFTVVIDSKVAVLRLCRYVESAGIGDDARAMTQMNRTLGQFNTVDKVVVLDRDRNCFGDQSGLNRCYNDLPPGQKP